MAKVRELFRDNESTEFVIVTIPTVIYLALRKLLLPCCASSVSANVLYLVPQAIHD